MKKRILLTGLVALISGVPLIKAQVTIGSGIPPSNGALLELKEYDHPQGTGNSTAHKGLLFPRVELSDPYNLFPMFDRVEIHNSKEHYVRNDGTQDIYYLKSTEDSTHIGLVVYNIDASVFSESLHFWNGTRWLQLDGSVPVKPGIESLICGSKTVALNRLEVGTPYDQIMKIPYTGGNGAAYSATAPDDLGNGLSIERLAGTLAYGQGEVAYRIFGTPTTLPTDKIISIPIEFLGETCTITLGDDTEIKNMSFMRKTVLLNTETTANSEMTFGNLKVRFTYVNENQVMPEITTNGINVHALCWFRKTGGHNASAYGDIADFFSFYAHISIIAGAWSNFSPGSSGTDESRLLNARNRDIGEAIIVFQHNTFMDVYRLTFNVYQSLSADSGIAAVSGSATIFIEKLD